MTYQVAYDLLTPLNSLSARFHGTREAPELDQRLGRRVAIQVPTDAAGPLIGVYDPAPGSNERAKAQAVFLKDGTVWLFDERGDLAEVREGASVVTYARRDGRVARIAASVGGKAAGQIDLEYGPEGRLSKAVGTVPAQAGAAAVAPETITYSYGADGRLAGVGTARGTAAYAYRGPLVTAVTWTPAAAGAKTETVRGFEYNAQGQVTAETRGAATVRHAFAALADGGVEATVTEPGAAAGLGDRTSVTRYDRQMRPVEARAADGARTVWRYPPTGGVEATVSVPGSRAVTVTDAPAPAAAGGATGGRELTVRDGAGIALAATFDAAGRPTAMSERGRAPVQQRWQASGQLAGVVTAGCATTYNYGPDGLLGSVVERPAGAPERTGPWRETALDAAGRPVRMADSDGVKTELKYDADGAVSHAVQRAGNRELSFVIVKRDDAGRVAAVRSPGEQSSYAYTPAGDLARVETVRGTSTASVALAAGGRVRSVTGFDRGVTEFDYVEQGEMAGALRGVRCPNGLAISHQYDANKRLQSVGVGADRRVELEYDAAGRVVGYTIAPAAR